MAWVACDLDGTECIIHDLYTPVRGYYEEHRGIWLGIRINLPKGSIKKLIGRDLTWEDNPVELK